jgi:hypothetical protein
VRRFLLLLLLTVLSTGCASSGFVGSPAPPPGYASPALGEAPALDSVNAVLSQGRFVVEVTDGRSILDARQVEVGPETTRVVRTNGADPQVQYVPTDRVESVTAARKTSGAEVGAFIGAVPGAVLAGAGLAALAATDCSADCSLGAILTVALIGVGVLGAGGGGLLGGAIGALVSPDRSPAVHYEGPVTRYLPEPTPSTTTDL